MLLLGKFGKIVCRPPLPDGWRLHLGEILDPPLIFLYYFKLMSQNLSSSSTVKVFMVLKLSSLVK